MRFRTARSKSSFIITPSARARPAFMPMVGIGHRVIALSGRAEGPLHVGVVVEERQEDRDAFDDGRAKFQLKALPVMIEPAFHGIKLRTLACDDLVRCGIGVVLERNLALLQKLAEFLCGDGMVLVPRFFENEVNRLKLSVMFGGVIVR